MSNINLYGDAKATARTAEAGKKEATLKAALQKHSEEPSRATHMAMAMALFDVGRFEEAANQFNAMLTLYGDDIQVLYELAFTYKNMKRVEDAKATFLRAVALDSRHSLARSAEHEIWMLDPTYKPSWMRK